MWIDTHNAFLEYTELLKSLTELEYLRMQAPIKSILTHSALCDAIFEKANLEYLHLEYMVDKVKIPR